ncbi:hypothetical protein EV122DRAFT_282736 [Schizophyllum commune]
MHNLSVDELLERAATDANLEMLRTHAEPSRFQIAVINWATSLLESELESLPPDDPPTRKKILAQLDINRAILAPIRRLPKELLIEIFFFAAYGSSLRTLQAAVTIARVCAVWRSVSRGLSKLWTRLIDTSLSDFDQYCELFLPIPTKPDLPGLRCDDPKLLKPLWDRIEPYASCWRSITLESPLNMLPDLQVLYMENLERLAIDAYGDPVSLEISALDFVVAPSLRHVGLTLDALQSERQLHVPVARGLASLEITTESPFPVILTLPLLQACADTLRSLTLRVRYPLEGAEGSYPTSPSDTFEMKALTFLSLVDPACALLNHITAQNIEELMLSNVPTYGTQSLLGFLTRSQEVPTLLALRVYIPEEREASAWIPSIRLMNKLRHLHFDDMLSNTEFLKQIVLHTDRPSLLPSLAWFNIARIYTDNEELRPAIRECAMTIQSARVVLDRAASVANIAMLRANDLPSQIQIMSINELTALLISELASLSPDNTTTSETHSRILDQLDIHRSIVAPIRRLPKELLIDIFFRVADESPFLTLHVAVTLARVCAVWRAVAHGLSKLWTRLVVKSISDFDQYCELFLPITREPHLPGLRCDDPALLKRLWDRIEPYASCWRSITLEGSLRTFPDLRVLHMENLERLTVNAYDAPLSSDLSALDFVVAPRLRHIALTLDELHSERQLHIPVTHALTYLNIDVLTPFPITHTLPLLRACADTLEFLALKVRYPLDGPEGSYPTSPSDTFVMKALSIVSLIDPACALLNHITAPNIEELALGNVPAYGTRSLMGFLTRDQTSRHLRALRVYTVAERDMFAWIPCLRLMDKLKHLYFDELLSNRQFLEVLIRHADRPPLLPSLRNIAIWSIFRKRKDLHDIIGEMCASRANFTVVNGRRRLETIGWITEE